MTREREWKPPPIETVEAYREVAWRLALSEDDPHVHPLLVAWRAEAEGHPYYVRYGFLALEALVEEGLLRRVSEHCYTTHAHAAEFHEGEAYEPPLRS